jgi:chemotaxis protein methyltransferase CheR
MNRSPAGEAVVDRVAELLRLQIGLRPEPTLRGRLRRCIRDEATAHGQDVDAYLLTLLTGSDALQGLLNRVTVQETSFFRHPEHFQVLARDILPNLDQPITIWSAGCANGQEAFSLAMLLEEQGVDGRVLATDLSSAALQRTTAAQYTTRELTGLSPERIARHLSHSSHGWQISKNVRDRVTTLRHNLIEAIPGQVRSSQVVFCRNVLIYFAPEHAKTFLDRVADTLPAAAVFLGSAETIWSVSDRFATVRVGDAFYHRRRPDASPGVRGTADTLEPAHSHRDRPRDGGRSAPVGKQTDARRALTVSDRGRTTRFPARPVAVPTLSTAENDSTAAARLVRAGQQALDAGDHNSAVVAFRKWAYLTPDDPLAHLHLGLALEASGDHASAQRAYGTARRALLETASGHVEDAIGGYATAELLRLLDTKRQVLAP